jgi:hypothetical protein
MRWLLALAAAVSLSIALALGSPSGHAEPEGCGKRSPAMAAIIDGDLYAMVRSQRGRYLFGSSGEPLLDVQEAIRLLRALGLTGSDEALVRFASNAHTIVGGHFFNGGGSSYFDFACPGAYRLTAVVRQTPFPPTRIWLQQRQRGAERVVRSFCMPPQLLEGGVRISVSFRAPLGKVPPRYEIDLDADGVTDRSGAFRPGGADFPSDTRCPRASR